MKRKTLKLVACAAIMALTLSMTACGGDDAAATTGTETTDTASVDGYTTLEDYYNDPTVKAALDGMFSSMAGDGMEAACEVKGNEFTVIIKITDSSMIVDGMGEALAAALDAQEDTFKEQVKQFDDVIEQEGASTVIMRYTDPDDNVLAEKAFTAN